MIVTQNGEAKVVIQDLREYEEMQESLAMLKILVLGTEQIKAKRYKSVDESFRNVRDRIDAIRKA